MARVIVDGKFIECESTGEVSDGFHTFDELYDHRCLLYVNLCLMMASRAVWRPHGPSWFLLYLETDQGQLSYHLPMKFLSLVEGNIKRNDAHLWDGHTSVDVAQRLITMAESKATKPKVVAEDHHEHCENCGASIVGFHGCHD